MKRKIAVVTGSRADYGHLYWLMRAIHEDPSLELQVIATAMHLLKEHGCTYRQILKDKFPLKAKVDILRFGNSDVGVAKSVGKGMELFADAYKKLQPDIVVLLGDRFETLAAATAAYIMKIPIAHIHGGELTLGVLDEAFRHSISKMASIHFAATEDYRQRIIQLGEEPKRVFAYGAPGLDAIFNLHFYNKQQIAKRINFDTHGPIAIMTYHPESLHKESPQAQMDEILKAIGKFSFKVLFTKANADPMGEMINQRLQAFCRKNPQKYVLVSHLGQHLYYSCLKHFDLMIGNSSSGLVEAPSFYIPVVNIGDRQRGRVQSKNVINVKVKEKDISKGIKQALTKDFRSSLKGLKNPYLQIHRGTVSQTIKDKLKNLKIDQGLFFKEFHDILLAK